MLFRYLALLALTAAPAFGQIVTYDGTAFPEDVGWIRSVQAKKFIAARFLDDGWFVQTPQLIEGKPGNEQDFYTWNLTEQAGAQAWFLEWVMVTDGPASFGAVAPASIVAGGQSGILYHFTIGVNELALKRGSRFPLVFHSFEPGVHEFRVEIFNGTEPATYTFYFDGDCHRFWRSGRVLPNGRLSRQIRCPGGHRGQ